MAQQVIPKAAFGYIASGRRILSLCVRVVPRPTTNSSFLIHFAMKIQVQRLNLQAEKLSSPIIMAPVAAHKLANERGEVATARGVHGWFLSIQLALLYCRPSEITEALQGTPHWFQFYFSKMMVSIAMDRVKAEGYKSLMS